MANTTVFLSPNGVSCAAAQHNRRRKGCGELGRKYDSPKSEFQCGMPFLHGSPHTHLYPKIICMELTLNVNVLKTHVSVCFFFFIGSHILLLFAGETYP